MHEITDLTAAQLAEAIRSRRLSSQEAVRAFLARIDEVNPKLNAIVVLCRQSALEEARRADKAVEGGEGLGPLHGVPVTIKDAYEMSGVVSSGGTLGRKDFVPDRDATVVDRLRAGRLR